MMKPTILVTTATGKTGAATTLQLLEQGYPVRALVRRANHRSERLRQAGAELVVGALDDIVAMRQALDGVQRAYYNPPISRDALTTSAIFAVAAEERKLEMVTVMSQWLADPANPSPLTRALWLGDRLLAWAPTVATVTVNPGWFADNYRAAGLDVMAQLGVMTLPLGDGLNAPPSNEDIARVIVGTLTNPAPHIGKTYRPTGPRLLSPPEIADAFGKALGRRVRYQNAPLWLFSKVAKSVGQPDVTDFQIAQMFTYFEEYQRNAFGVGAPTSAVLEVSGREPEDFETIARRYVSAAPHTRRNVSGFSHAMWGLAKALLTPGLDPVAYAARLEFPKAIHTRFTGDSPEWLATHAPDSAATSVPVARGGHSHARTA